MAVALLAAFLQGCGQGKGEKGWYSAGRWYSESDPPEKVVKDGKVCTVQQHLENVKINGRDLKLSDFKKAGCKPKYDVRWKQVFQFYDHLKPIPPKIISNVQDISPDFPSDFWSKGDVLTWGAANSSFVGLWKGVHTWIVQGRTDHNMKGGVVVDCEIKGLKIFLGVVQTIVIDVFGARLTNAKDTCRQPFVTSIDNVFPAESPCTVEKALMNLEINGGHNAVSKYEQEGCVLISNVDRSCWNAGVKEITFDKVENCWQPDESECLQVVEGGNHELKPGDDGRSWVYLDCEDKGLKVRLTSHSTDVFQREGNSYKYTVSAPSTCHEKLAIRNRLGFQTSLIQRVEAHSTNLQSGPNLHKTNATREVLTPQGNTLFADKTASSSQPLHLVPWAKRSLDLATLHEIVKLAPDDSFPLSAGATR